RNDEVATMAGPAPVRSDPERLPGRRGMWCHYAMTQRMLRHLLGLAAVVVVAGGCKKNDQTVVDDTGPAAQAEPTPAEQPAYASQVATEELTYRAGDVTMKGFLAYPANAPGKVPGVLVMHECWGLDDY